MRSPDPYLDLGPLRGRGGAEMGKRREREGEGEGGGVEGKRREGPQVTVEPGGPSLLYATGITSRLVHSACDQLTDELLPTSLSTRPSYFICKRVLLRLTISFPIRTAIALASSTRPARISLLFLCSSALMNGVTYSGSRKRTVVVLSG